MSQVKIMGGTPRPRIPLGLKLSYSAFTAVLIWQYWRNYGPQNFLNFCDIAVLVTLIGLWLENTLLISTQALSVVLVQLLWLVDFLAHFIGFDPLRMTSYMFNEKYPLFLRLLSLFHGWMPFLLLWLVCRLGYDRRALLLQTIAGVCLLLISYFCFAPPGTHDTGKMPANLNLVFGISASTPQTLMPPLAWLAMLVVGTPVVVYLPTHLILNRIKGNRTNG